MKFVIQRVTHAEVAVDGQTVGSIGKGFLILVGVGKGDTKEQADKLIKKTVGLRIFEDENGKTNLSLDAVGGEVLVISQFTLYADCMSKGYRPSFTAAELPEPANAMYEYVLEQFKAAMGTDEYGKSRVQQGIFGADMKVSLLNDGPFTVILES